MPEKAAEASIEEARMLLPGILALSGLQMIAALSQAFYDLPEAGILEAPGRLKRLVG